MLGGCLPLVDGGAAALQFLTSWQLQDSEGQLPLPQPPLAPQLLLKGQLPCSFVSGTSQAASFIMALYAYTLEGAQQLPKHCVERKG